MSISTTHDASYKSSNEDESFQMRSHLLVQLVALVRANFLEAASSGTVVAMVTWLLWKHNVHKESDFLNKYR